MSIMNGQNQGNIKTLLESVPAGFLVDSTWLTTHGIGRRSAYAYVKRGWLERVARGVYRRPGPGPSGSGMLDWKICLLSLQHIMRHDFHVGGTTALHLQGYDHYLRLGGNAPVWVYGKVPAWLPRLPLDAKLVMHNQSLFLNTELGLVESGTSLGTSLPWNWQLKLSSPERAVLETINELPKQESFHSLDMMFESLTTLRPRLLAQLLHDCTSIKVKRLFFVFADRHNHAWRKRLDPQEFNLGNGDRALVRGGKIHPDYRIMVPGEFLASEVGHGP